VSAPRLWTDLRRFTQARVGLGRAGNAVPTAAHLAFQADHAAARDAVHTALDVPALRRDLGIEAPWVQSAAPDRATYLLRPDLGRILHPDCRLDPLPGCVAVVIADGLSAIAAQRHAAPLIATMRHTGPIVIATQARVALGDDIGALLQAEAVLVLIGERPGLSAADSLGAYLTWQPRRGRTDAERNCVSNIRPEGLPIAEAAQKLSWLIGAMRRLQLSGVALKDEQPSYDRSISVEIT
jgi:ethanolamine ammonia-lyase small subunit